MCEQNRYNYRTAYDSQTYLALNIQATLNGFRCDFDVRMHVEVHDAHHPKVEWCCFCVFVCGQIIWETFPTNSKLMINSGANPLWQTRQRYSRVSTLKKNHRWYPEQKIGHCIRLLVDAKNCDAHCSHHFHRQMRFACRFVSWQLFGNAKQKNFDKFVQPQIVCEENGHVFD